MRLSVWSPAKVCLAAWPVLLALPVPGGAQPQSAPAVRREVVGSVTAVTPQTRQVSLQTDKGETIAVTTGDVTLILHMAPGVTDPAKAPRMTLPEIHEGDRVVAYYRGAADQKAVQATSLVVRTKADLAEIARRELDDWRRRGTVGLVTAVDVGSKSITLKVGSRSVTVTSSDKTEYRRYSLDSAKPADAKPSSLAEIKVGDQVHALGDRSPDGATTTAEIVYAGTFRQLAATVVSVNAASGEMQVKDLATKKPLTIRVDSDSIMKKLDPETSATLARRYGPGRGQGAAAGSAPDGRGGQRGGGGGRGAGGDLSQILDRLPAIPLAELKAGDAVMVSTTMGSDPSHVTAIMLLAGVEPLITAAPNAARDIMSGWNLGGAGGGGEGN
jgi:hypothetical protein